MIDRKMLAILSAALLTFVFASNVAAAPGENEQRRDYQQREYLFESSEFYSGQNIFFKRDVVDGVLQVFDHRNYNWGAYIGGFALAPGSTPDRPRIVDERSGFLNYSRDLRRMYRRLEAVIAPSYVWRSVGDQEFVGTCKILLDGREVYSRRIYKDNSTEKISLDLQGVRRLEIQLQGKSLCFFDPFLVR